MLADVKNTKLFAEWAKFISENDTRQAFVHLTGKLTTGSIKDFRFYNEAGEQPFSFITNRKWLTFYFRKPAFALGSVSRAKIEADFDSFNENTAGEYTVKLRSISDVERLRKHVTFL